MDIKHEVTQTEVSQKDSSQKDSSQKDSSQKDSSLLASFPNYLDAQRLVDRMSDDGFPVESVRIIGDGVRTVEQVTGRMTRARAAAAGAASGAWFGVFIGLLFGLFSAGQTWAWFVFISLAVGAFWGAVFGFVAHWSTRGRRDFASVMTLQARRYEVHVNRERAAEAAKYVL